MIKDQIIIIGRIGSPYGIEGDLRLFLFTNPPEKAIDYKNWLIKKENHNSWLELSDEAVYQMGEKYLIHLEGVDSPEEAKTFVNAEIGVRRSELEKPNEDEFYWADLIGLTVKNAQNEIFGVVTELFETAGANDVLVVKNNNGERLIPFVGYYILDIDFQKKLILVDWQKDY